MNTPGCFRLPTEAEWEYAARAGTTGAYSIPGDPSDFAWSIENSGKRTHPVAENTEKANAWGLYDIHGNVYEWVQDWYGDYPSYHVKDPVGPSSGYERVKRSGSWISYAQPVGYSRGSQQYANHPH